MDPFYVKKEASPNFGYKVRFGPGPHSTDPTDSVDILLLGGKEATTFEFLNKPKKKDKSSFTARRYLLVYGSG